MEVRTCCCGSEAPSIQSYARQGYIPDSIRGVAPTDRTPEAWRQAEDWPYFCDSCGWATYKCRCPGARCHDTGIHDDNYAP